MPNALVSRYDGLIDTLVLPDPNDRHVLAAAITANAAYIVTYNLSDFPVATLASFGVTPVHPDVFLCALFERNPGLFMRGVHSHIASLINPTKSVPEYLDTLRSNRLGNLAILLDQRLGHPDR